jgi:hypothetical protein
MLSPNRKMGEFGGPIAADRYGSCCISTSIATQGAQTIEECFGVGIMLVLQNLLKTSKTKEIYSTLFNIF